MNRHSTKFTFGDIVFKLIDQDKLPMMVICIQLNIGNTRYGCSRPGADDTFWFYEMELTSEIDEIKLFPHLL